MPDIDIPNEVASTSFVSQTANLATTTVFTASATGMYRFNAYVESLADTGSKGTVTAKFSWTDDNSSTFSLPVSLSPPSTVTQATWVNITQPIRMANGTTFTVAATLPSGGPTYSIYVTVEQL